MPLPLRVSFSRVVGLACVLSLAGACGPVQAPGDDVPSSLETTEQPQVVALVAPGSTWRYRDTGVDPGAGWTTPGYVDTAWKEGPAQLGYGDGDEATVVSYGPSTSSRYVTTWFRKAFTVADPARVGAVALRLLRDDGAIVYVNGREVFRSNLPASGVTASTLATTTIADSAEQTWHPASVPASVLVAGANVIAVEVHQSTLNSSDLSFDLELTADVAPTTATPCWPLDLPALGTLRAAPRKVFAHYFSPYPLSLDNRDPSVDYYARNYLVPTGENSKFAYCGGFIKQRPLPQAPRASGVDYELKNFEQEVRRAAALGLDGFTYDILNHTGTHWNRLLKLLQAASNADSGFRVVLMPDMSSTYTGTDADALTAFVGSIGSVASHPAVYHLDDGRLLLAPYMADNRTPQWWASVLQALQARGISAALWPVYVKPWLAQTQTLAAQVPLYGTSTWGNRTLSGAAAQRTHPATAHGLGLQWMAPVALQDSRPKDLVYTEPNNSQTLRAMWDAAIQGGADWVQLITWNDYSEATEFSPSSGTQWAAFDLTAYYTAWFKLGAQPTITRDALYYFHRRHSTSAAPDLTQQRAPYTVVNGAAPANEIELLAFLTAPGTLEIEVAGTVQRKDVAAGIQSFRVPLQQGTPTFRLVRGGATVAAVTSAFPINDTITYQDMLYRAGGSLSCDRSPFFP
ncbi:glycoside hydrolase family 71 protein [Myxococcus stipitatus]|uniref:glycoside hydrolase family 71 protein n=1 Tax=Myxococcus stipitatus TaxID=83455 RepID=UPI001F20F1D5|nr:glycoside hydrolase family 71 protein [Myxococcus stipitatus]MCE9672124.1 glycoside hydrolase family 71 protein [Myxococcus stipitatus]